MDCSTILNDCRGGEHPELSRIVWTGFIDDRGREDFWELTEKSSCDSSRPLLRSDQRSRSISIVVPDPILKGNFGFSLLLAKDCASVAVVPVTALLIARCA